MNAIFNFVFILCLSLMLIFNPSNALSTVLSAGEKAVNLCITLISIYAIWLGILEIAEQSGLNKVLAKILKPLIKFLFGK